MTVWLTLSLLTWVQPWVSKWAHPACQRVSSFDQITLPITMVLKTGSPKELSILLVHWQSPICIKSECLREGTLWFRVSVVFKTPCWVKFTIMTEIHWYWMNMEAMWSHTEAWLIDFSHYPKIYANTDLIGWAVTGIIKAFGFASFPLLLKISRYPCFMWAMSIDIYYTRN